MSNTLNTSSENQKKTKLGIVGSREFPNLHLVDVLLLKLSKDEYEIVSGGALGVDIYAEEQARALGFDCVIFYPNKALGKRGFLERNSQIVGYSDLVVAFYDGKSTGTLDSMKKAVAAGKLRKVFKEFDEESTISL